MSADGWRRIKDVLAEALDKSTGDRAAYLDEACAGDDALRAEVESLLAADDNAGTFIDTPAFGAAESPDDAEPNLGRQIGPYAIERLIGRGGMGSVYLARRVDHEFDRLVAIKMIRRGMDSDLLVKRFRHERQILASLDHPHIARLFDGGTTDDGLPYFVMEYVDGVAIDRYANDHRLTTPERLLLSLRVIDAVQHAHERQIVHRDLKPSNVLVTPDGQPKLLDFGIAKLLDPEADGTSTLTSMARPMTPDYASPEQVRGDPVTQASDVYALGLLLYELLTGHRPYRLTTHTPEEMARVVCEQDPERPSAAVARADTVTHVDGATAVTTPASVSETRDGSPERLRQRLSGALDDIVLKALRKDPGSRYASASALAGDIRRYLDDAPVDASRGAWRYRARRFLARHRTAIAASLVILATIGLTAAAVMRFAAPAPKAATGSEGSTRPPARRSAAVLRFRNLSAQPADAWLSTALAEMLTTELGGGGHLRLVPSDVVARVERDTSVDPTQAAPLERIREAAAADYVVVGSFVVGPAPARTVRIDVKVAAGPDPDIAIAETGAEGDLFALVAATGRALRQRLGVDDNTADAMRGVRAALPQGVDATRLYAEGLERLRELDAVTARDRLERASALEPANPLIHVALAAAWTSLGYDARAVKSAQKAFDGSAGLTREDRLNVEGRLHETQKNWAKAIDVYRTLWGYFADNPEYGLRLATALTSSGKAAEALVTVAELRALPAPSSADARVDLADAQAASALGDFPHELKAARQALQHARTAGSRQLAARAEVAEGRSLYNQGQLPLAEQSLETARRTFEAAGDRAGAAGALNSLGTVVDDRGDTPRAERAYRDSLAASEAVGDRRGMSSALNNLGILLKDHGRLAEARQTHERALALRREIGDRNWTGVSLNNIGVVLFEQDRLKEAASYYDESLTIAREIGDRRSEVRALHNLAIVQREAGNVKAARAGFEQAIPVRAEIRDKRGGVMARVELGMVLLAQGEVVAARRIEEEAVTLARDVPLVEGEAQAEFQLGEITLAAGDVATARRHHEASLALRQKLAQTRTVLESQVALAGLALEEGHPAEAERLVRDALAPAQEQAAVRVQGELVLGQARLAARDVGGAVRAAVRARALVANSERVTVRWAVDMLDARIALAQGQPAQARATLAQRRRTLAPLGLVLTDLETRLVLVEAARALHEPSATRDIDALIADATALGAGLIRRKAESLRGS